MWNFGFLFNAFWDRNLFFRMEFENLGVDALYVLYCDRAGRRFFQRMPTLSGLRIDWIGTKFNDDFVQLDGV